MVMISKAAMGLAVGVAGIFVGYCFYFDAKRRSEPDFRKKLRERRKARKAPKKSHSTPLKMNDPEVVQRFFLQEVQLGEEMLSEGHVEEGVDHLAHAVVVCGQPNELLLVLQKTLPPQIFCLLVQRLPSVSAEIAVQTMAEEDVE